MNLTPSLMFVVHICVRCKLNSQSRFCFPPQVSGNFWEKVELARTHRHLRSSKNVSLVSRPVNTLKNRGQFPENPQLASGKEGTSQVY